MKIISYKLYNNIKEIGNKDDIIEFTIKTKLNIENCSENIDKYDCCKSKNKGCTLYIDEYGLNICHFHLFRLLDSLHSLLNEIKDYQIAVIKLLDLTIIANKSKLIYIRKQIYNYLYELFKQHSEEGLFFNKNLSDNQKNVVYYFEDREKKEKNEAEYIKTLSSGEYQHYQIKKLIINKVQDCAYYDKILYYPEKKAIKNPVTSLISYSSIRDIKCKSSQHKNNVFAVLTVMDHRDDCFAFSYCERCLYDYYLVLYLAYTNYDKEEFTVGSFKVIHKPSCETCFFTGVIEPRMYQIIHNSVSFFVCQNSLEMLFKTIVYSAAFQELYPKEAREASSLMNKKEELYIEHCEKTISELNEEIQKLKQANNELSNQNAYLRDKDKHVDEIFNEEKHRLALKINDQVLNCLLLDNSIYLSVKRKIAQKSNNNDFKISFVSGIECKTLDHCGRKDLVALLELNRENDIFCLALCQTCIDYILQGIDAVLHYRKDFVCDFVKFKIEIKHNGAHHCYNCGGKPQRMFDISLCNVDFTLCSSCLLKLQNTLKEAKKTFILISQIGGIEFLRNGVLDLKI